MVSQNTVRIVAVNFFYSTKMRRPVVTQCCGAARGVWTGRWAIETDTFINTYILKGYGDVYMKDRLVIETPGGVVVVREDNPDFEHFSHMYRGSEHDEYSCALCLRDADCMESRE